MNKNITFALLTASLLALPAAAQTDSTAVKADTLAVPTVAVADTAAVSVQAEPSAKEAKAAKKAKKQKAPKAKKQKTSKKNSKKGGDAEAAKAGLKAIIEKYDTHTADTVVKQVVEEYSYDPSVAVSAAHSFLWRKNGGADVDQMQKYIDKALAFNPQCAPAYQLQANYYESSLGNDTLKAMACYDKIIEISPTSPVGYEGKASLLRDHNPEGAEAVLNAAKQQIPTFPVNIRLARLYDYRYNLYLLGRMAFDAEDVNKVVKHIELAERDSMTSDDYYSFSNWFFTAANLAKNTDYNLNGLNLAKEGIERYPDATRLNQVAMFNAVARGLYKDAVPYGEKFIASGDTLIDANTYYYMERAYYGAHQYEKCIKACEALLARSDASDDNRSHAVGNIAKSYKELGEYDKADNVYAEYIESRRASGTLTFSDMFGYAKMYEEKAEESNGQEKIDAYNKAYQLYGEAAKIMDEQDYLGYYAQMRMADIVDADQSKAMLLAPGQAIFNILRSKADINSSESSVLLFACQKVGYYYVSKKKDFAKARPYWDKAYELDPTNEFTLNVMKSVYKKKL